jgi:hypothetical protein
MSEMFCHFRGNLPTGQAGGNLYAIKNKRFPLSWE